MSRGRPRATLHSIQYLPNISFKFLVSFNKNETLLNIKVNEVPSQRVFLLNLWNKLFVEKKRSWEETNEEENFQTNERFKTRDIVFLLVHSCTRSEARFYFLRFLNLNRTRNIIILILSIFLTLACNHVIHFSQVKEEDRRQTRGVGQDDSRMTSYLLVS